MQFKQIQQNSTTEIWSVQYTLKYWSKIGIQLLLNSATIKHEWIQYIFNMF